jgi:hypothetical protein
MKLTADDKFALCILVPITLYFACEISAWWIR